MSNITQYTKDNQIFYQYKTQTFCAYTSGASGSSGVSGLSGASGSSGASGTSGASGASGVSGASYSSGASGASGASGYYIDVVKTVTVDKLSIVQLADLIKKGEIEISEVEKWCKSKNVPYEIIEKGNLNCLSFKYFNKQYTLNCNKKLDTTDSADDKVLETANSSPVKTNYKETETAGVYEKDGIKYIFNKEQAKFIEINTSKVDSKNSVSEQEQETSSTNITNPETEEIGVTVVIEEKLNNEINNEENVQLLNEYKEKYPNLANCMVSIFNNFPLEYTDFVIEEVFLLQKEVKGLDKLTDEELCDFIKTEQFVDLASTTIEVHQTMEEDEEVTSFARGMRISNLSDEVENVLTSTGIIDITNTLVEATSTSIQPDPYFENIFSDEQKRDKFLNNLESSIKQSGIEQMTMEEFMYHFGNAAKININDEKDFCPSETNLFKYACKFLDDYDRARQYTFGFLPNIQSETGIIYEMNGVFNNVEGYYINALNFFQGDWRSSANFALDKLVNNANTNVFWSNIFGEVPGLFSSLTAGDCDLEHFVEVGAKIIVKTACSGLDKITTVNGVVWKSIGAASGVITGLAIDFITGCLYTKDNGKLAFSFKQGFKSLWSDYYNMAVGTWNSACSIWYTIKDIFTKDREHIPLDDLVKASAHRYNLDDDLKSYLEFALKDSIIESKGLEVLLKQVQTKGYISYKKLNNLSEFEMEIFNDIISSKIDIDNLEKEVDYFLKEQSFNGHYIYAGGTILESYAQKLVQNRQCSDIEEARNRISERLGLNEKGGVVCYYSPESLMEEISILIDNDLLGVKGREMEVQVLLDGYTSAKSRYNYLKAQGRDKEAENCKLSAEGYMQKADKIMNDIQRYYTVQSVSKMLHDTLNAIVVDSGKGKNINIVDADYTKLEDYIYKLYDIDEAMGYNSYQIHLRMADRWANLDRLKDTINNKEGADYEFVTTILSDIECDDIKSYNYLNHPGFLNGDDFRCDYQYDDYTSCYPPGVNVIHDSIRNITSYHQMASYVDNLRWRMQCLQSDAWAYNAFYNHTYGVKQEFLLQPCRDYNYEIEKCEKEIQRIESEVEDAKMKYYESMVTHGADSEEAQRALKSYQDMNEYYYSDSSKGAKDTVMFQYNW